MSQPVETPTDLLSVLTYPIGIFAIVGVGVGLTAATQAAVLGGGSAIFSGLITLTTVSVSLLLGPVVAAIVGIQMSKREQNSSPIGSLVGCSAGFITMMVILLLILFLGIVLTTMGGAGAETGATGAESGATGGGLDVTQYILPIVLITIPTGLTGAATNILQSSFATGGTGSGNDSQIDIPTKYVAGAVIAIVLIAGVGYGASAVLNSPADKLEVQGEGYSSTGTLYAVADISNPGDNSATASFSVRMKIDGEVKESWTTSSQIDVDSGETIEREVELGQFSDLTEEETTAIQDRNFEVEFLINGQVKDTYTE